MNMLKSNVQNERETKTSPWTEKDKMNLIQLYPYKTNKELCEILEKTDGQLRGMKSHLGLNKKFKPLTLKEKEEIEKFYKNNPNEMNLEEFSKKLGRQKTSISRYARKIGLTKYNRKFSKQSIEKMKNSLSIYRETDTYKNIVLKSQTSLLKYYAQNEHPRGMLNKHHTDYTKNKMSKSHIELSKKMTYEEKHKIAMKAVETKRKTGGFHTTSNAYSRCKGGYRNDLNQYFRSAWEANIARLLNHFNIIWKYEIKRFNFDKEVSGVISYQPDFYLPQYDIWIEVKGWMDAKSIKRLELFEKYFPCEYKKLFLIDEKVYNDLNKIYASSIKNWEHKGKYLKTGYDKENPRTEIEVVTHD